MNTKLKFGLAFYTITALLILGAIGALITFASPPSDAPLAPPGQ